MDQTHEYTLGTHRFRSRLIIGSGKYRIVRSRTSPAPRPAAPRWSRWHCGAPTLDASQPWPGLLDFISARPVHHPAEHRRLLFTRAKTRITTAQLGRELLGTELVKLEVIGDERTLFPDTAATLEAAKVLVDDGFTVLPYISDDPVACQRLAGLGCAAVMPLAAPIGSGLGIRNPANLRIILETVEVPVIVDAGVGTASDAAVAMELGATAVLMNTGIAAAKDPVKMARSMKLAIEAGRLAYEAGRMPRRLYASASSPLEGTANF